MSGQEVPGAIRVVNTHEFEVGQRVVISSDAGERSLMITAVNPTVNLVTVEDAPVVAGVDHASEPDRTVFAGVDESGRWVDDVRRSAQETLASDFSEIERRFAAEMALHNTEWADARMMEGARADPSRHSSGGTVTGRMSANAPNLSSLPRFDTPRTVIPRSREVQGVIQDVYDMARQGLREAARLADQENERGRRVFTISIDYEQAHLVGRDPQEVEAGLAAALRQAFTGAEEERLFPRGVTFHTDVDRDIRTRQYQIAVVIDYSRVRPVVRAQPRHLANPDGLAIPSDHGFRVSTDGEFRVSSEIIRAVPVGNRGEIRYKAGEIRSLKDLDSFLKEASAAVRADLLKQKVIGPESDSALKPVQKRRLTVKKEG